MRSLSMNAVQPKCTAQFSFASDMAFFIYSGFYLQMFLFLSVSMYAISHWIILSKKKSFCVHCNVSLVLFHHPLEKSYTDYDIMQYGYTTCTTLYGVHNISWAEQCSNRILQFRTASIRATATGRKQTLNRLNHALDIFVGKCATTYQARNITWKTLQMTFFPPKMH